MKNNDYKQALAEFTESLQDSFRRYKSERAEATDICSAEIDKATDKWWDATHDENGDRLYETTSEAGSIHRAEVSEATARKREVTLKSLREQMDRLQGIWDTHRDVWTQSQRHFEAFMAVLKSMRDPKNWQSNLQSE